MFISAAARNTAMLVLTAGAIGCASLGGKPTARASTCFPQQCFIEVRNEQSKTIGVRYYDSTGVGDLLGAVQSGAVRRFVLSRRTSRTITVEVSYDRQVYRAQTVLRDHGYQDVIHFPSDFEVKVASRR